MSVRGIMGVRAVMSVRGVTGVRGVRDVRGVMGVRGVLAKPPQTLFPHCSPALPETKKGQDSGRIPTDSMGFHLGFNRFWGIPL